MHKALSLAYEAGFAAIKITMAIAIAIISSKSLFNKLSKARRHIS